MGLQGQEQAQGGCRARGCSLGPGPLCTLWPPQPGALPSALGSAGLHLGAREEGPRSRLWAPLSSGQVGGLAWWIPSYQEGDPVGPNSRTLVQPAKVQCHGASRPDAEVRAWTRDRQPQRSPPCWDLGTGDGEQGPTAQTRTMRGARRAPWPVWKAEPRALREPGHAPAREVLTSVGRRGRLQGEPDAPGDPRAKGTGKRLAAETRRRSAST